MTLVEKISCTNLEVTIEVATNASHTLIFVERLKEKSRKRQVG